MVEALIPTAGEARLLRHFAHLSLGFWIGPTGRKATFFVLGLFGCLLSRRPSR
jgi:vitamin B12/bleomycin/antimicrobial peptide transport system ATP-binding/permease protein